MEYVYKTGLLNRKISIFSTSLGPLASQGVSPHDSRLLKTLLTPLKNNLNIKFQASIISEKRYF